MIGQRVGPYDLLELLGKGGVGEVYRARDPVLGRQVAIKTLRAGLSRDQDFITRFYQEAQSLGELSHPNITTLYALHLEGDEPFMVMELVRGQTLEAVLEQVQHLPLRPSLAVIAQAVAGLSAAHRNGVIHRDIKPSNLMITGAGQLKIMDFGIARVRGSQRMTRAGQMFGTLIYASPEQIRGGDVDERSDVYSLAVVLYEMLAGTPPFIAENDLALMTAHLEAPPPPLASHVRELDASVEAAVAQALAKNPDHRFASIEEFGRATGATAVRGDAADILEEYLGSVVQRTDANLRSTRYISTPELSNSAVRAREGSEQPLLSTVQGTLGPSPRAAKSMKLPAAVLSAVVAAVIGGLGYLVWPAGAPEPSPRSAVVSEPTVLPSSSPTSKLSVTAPSSRPVAPAGSPLLAATPSSPPPSVRPAETPTALTSAEPSVRPTPAITPPPSTSVSPPDPALAPREPDLSGKVTAIQSASRLRVGNRWIELYGITDTTNNQPQHIQAMVGYLQPTGGVVDCFAKSSGKFQCLAGGRDLADLAMRDRIARSDE